jgi:hypothetical protein
MRGLILGLAVGLAVLLTAGEGRAGFLNGQQLNEICNADALEQIQCSAYIQGVYDAGTLIAEGIDKRQWQGGWTSCVPDDVKLVQLKAVVKKWLREHPAEWHYFAAGLVAAALQEAFPCR